MKNLPFRTGELSLEEIKEQKDISNMTIKMSDLQARSTPPEVSPSNVQNPPSNVQNPPSNVQNSQKDEEGEKTSKIGSTTSISSKSSLLEDSQRFAFLSNTKALVFTTYTNINCDNFRSCGDTNSSSTKLDLIQITFEEPQIENSKEEDTVKETKGTGML